MNDRTPHCRSEPLALLPNSLHSSAVASVTSLVVLAAVAFYGGWEWILPCLIVLAALWRVPFDVVPVLATVGVSFFWLALFCWTGDRRFFFPYAMQFAVQMPYLLQDRVSMPATVGGGGVIAVFILIRMSQSASAGVLIVELIIAAAVLALVLRLCGPTARETKTRLIAGMLGSALAFVGLLL